MKANKTGKISKKTKSVSYKRTQLDETLPGAIREKTYITKQIQTSITLLKSRETSVVVESLLFLSKYADIQPNNVKFVQANGLMPKLLALPDHNICILRLSLRLLSQLLTVEAARLELNQPEFDYALLKICRLYMNFPDVPVKEFASEILATYSTMGKASVLLLEPFFITVVLRTVKDSETDTILLNTLKLFNKFLDIERFLSNLSHERDFNLTIFMQRMSTSDICFKTILDIFEKITYFGDNDLQHNVIQCGLVEHILELIIDPDRSHHVASCLKIIMHCMNNEKTSSHFITTLPFFRFLKWAKSCPEEHMLTCARIFLELARIDSIKQVLFDLSVDNTILSFLRSRDKSVLNVTCDAISYMSKHKYCCTNMLTPVVLKKLLQILRNSEDVEDPQNETAFSTLYYFARRDSRTVHMIQTYDGIDVLLDYLKRGTELLSVSSYKKVLEVANMFVTNILLRKFVLCSDLYQVLLKQATSRFDEICMCSLEIMINCLPDEDFQSYFLLNSGSEIICQKLAYESNEHIVRFLSVFVHNALLVSNMARTLVHNRILLILRNIPEAIKYRNPLIRRAIHLVYNMCLPIKFFETGRLDLTDKLDERFYVINGPWNETFPFLEVLELRRMSTLTTIYVIDECDMIVPECKPFDCLSIHQQSISGTLSSSSFSSAQTRCTINYGCLSHDPFLPKYITEVGKQLRGVLHLETKIRHLAKFVDSQLCGPDENSTDSDKLHTFKLHLECIKAKLGTNMIPIGYLRLGFHCERALLFKALADHVYIPTTLVRGRNKLYWNEVALIVHEGEKSFLKMFVVDLMNVVGHLLPLGSRECNAYCDVR